MTPKRPKLRLINTSTYVGIERAIVIGPNLRRPVEGQVYIAQPDGCLRPINGKELTELIEKYPGFVKHWRLDR